VLDAIDEAGWMRRCASVPQLGEPGIDVGHAFSTSSRSTRGPAQ